MVPAHIGISRRCRSSHVRPRNGPRPRGDEPFFEFEPTHKFSHHPPNMIRAGNIFPALIASARPDGEGMIMGVGGSLSLEGKCSSRSSTELLLKAVCGARAPA